MKRILFILVVVTFSAATIQSQNIGKASEMKAGISLSLPVGNFSEAYSFGLQADFDYLFDITEEFKAGPMASLIYYNGKSIGSSGYSMKISDVMFLPIGGHARYVFDEFFVGVDLAYAIGISPSGIDGGILFRPKVGYNLGNMAVVASYSAISRVGTIGSLNLGVEFSF